MRFACIIVLLISANTIGFTQSESEKSYVEDWYTCNASFADLERQVEGGMNGADLYLVDGEPFTGCARADYPDNNRYFMHHIRAGIVQQEVGFYYNGNMARTFNFSNGLKHGQHVMYEEDGSLYIEEYYDAGNPVYLKRWHANGQLAREARFEAGVKVFEKLYDEEGNELND